MQQKGDLSKGMFTNVEIRRTTTNVTHAIHILSKVPRYSVSEVNVILLFQDTQTIVLQLAEVYPKTMHLLLSSTVHNYHTKHEF